MSETRSDAVEVGNLFRELADMEFDSASDIQKYVKRVQDAAKSFALELEFAAEDLEARLRAVPPADAEDTSLVIARKAMRVAKHLVRASEDARAVGKNASKTWGSLRTHFEGQMAGREAKRKPKKQIDLES